MIDALRFSLTDVLSLLGLAQCLYVLTYISLRAGNLRQAFLPLFYFGVLAAGFVGDYVQAHLLIGLASFALALWAVWFSGPPLSAILIRGITGVVAPRDFAPLLGLPVAAFLAEIIAHHDRGCGNAASCGVLQGWLVIAGLAAGLIGIATLWPRRAAIRTLRIEREGAERYWLVVMLIVLNLAFLGVMLAGLTPLLNAGQVQVIKTLLGLGQVYLAGTTLFRIYPRRLTVIAPVKVATLSESDRLVAAKIESLLKLEKVYQEPAYNRSDLAKELEMPEGTVSRIINLHFNKTLPQLLNEYRIADARYLLRDGDQAIKLIADQVGFNSIASFNRVFREVTGTTPSAYRDELRKTASHG